MDQEIHSPGSKPNVLFLINGLKRWEAVTQQEVSYSIGAKHEDLVAWRMANRLPLDPWAHEPRRQSAVAAVLRYRGLDEEAEKLLNVACGVGYEESYAGYRSLARLSLACRWLAWGKLYQAYAQVDEARNDAGYMLDPVLKQDRLALVSRMDGWLAKYESGGFDQPVERILDQARAFIGVDRAVCVEFLASIWESSLENLIRLIPLALDDVTATDAVFSRILRASNPPAVEYTKINDVLLVDMPNYL
jgi:hypothetical protein